MAGIQTFNYMYKNMAIRKVNGVEEFRVVSAYFNLTNHSSRLLT